MVEAMLSRTAPVFYGDLRSHERVIFSFWHSLYIEDYDVFSLLDDGTMIIIGFAFVYRFHYRFPLLLAFVNDTGKMLTILAALILIQKNEGNLTQSKAVTNLLMLLRNKST